MDVNTFKHNSIYCSLANTNQYPGLARGPIDHQASSVINQINNTADIALGEAVKLHSPIDGAELLPRMTHVQTAGEQAYGICVGGDEDGIYGDGSSASDDELATTTVGQGIVIVTQGRCLARVSGFDNTGAGTGGAVAIGDELTPAGATLANSNGDLHKSVATTDQIIAIALQPVAEGDVDIIAVDVQRQGEVNTA